MEIQTRPMSIHRFANQFVCDLTAYEPGKPVEETARELGLRPEEVVKLASNENPLGPSPKAKKAMYALCRDKSCELLAVRAWTKIQSSHETRATDLAAEVGKIQKLQGVIWMSEASI